MVLVKTRILIIAFAAFFLSSFDGYACSRPGSVSSVEMVNQADGIVRAVAVEYVKAPRRFMFVWTDGEPDTTIRFRVLEVIRGSMPSQLILPGYLNDHDDFNDHRLIVLCVRTAGAVAVMPTPTVWVPNSC